MFTVSLAQLGVIAHSVGTFVDPSQHASKQCFACGLTLLTFGVLPKRKARGCAHRNPQNTHFVARQAASGTPTCGGVHPPVLQNVCYMFESRMFLRFICFLIYRLQKSENHILRSTVLVRFWSLEQGRLRRRDAGGVR